MSRSAGRLAAAALAIAAVSLATGAASAGPRDSAALKLDSDAMGGDYLETSFARAVKKLERALALCGASSCAPHTLAVLHRDLAVVYVAGLGRTDEGRVEMKKALAADPRIALDPDYATDDVKRLYAEAKGAPAARGPRRESDLEHEPVTEQKPSTPIPIAVKVNGDLKPTAIRVRYRPSSGARWRSVVLKRNGDAFTGQIPCGDVTEGELVYYIQAEDEDEDILARSGSSASPYKVAIREELEGDEPHLPDAEPPAQCSAADLAATRCHGAQCGEGTPAPGPPGKRTTWVTAGFEQDLAVMAGSDLSSACSKQTQIDGSFTCYRPQGSQYHGSPISGRDNSVSGGLAVATTRAVLGVDHAVGNFTVGARLGVVIAGSAPRPDGVDAHEFLPVSLEMRVAYWPGDDPFARSGLRPFFFVAGGAAQVDAHFTVVVHEDQSKTPPPSQIDNPKSQKLDTYREMGRTFIGGGAGAMLATSARTGVVLDVKAMQLLPTSGLALAPELAFALGF